MHCVICHNLMNKTFSAKILHQYSIDYFLCDNCGFLCTEKPHWLEQAYSNAIADADTGLVSRNVTIAQKISYLLYYLHGNSGSYIDFAGGTGLCVRLMRDIGFDFYWYDLYCNNIHARGFEFPNIKADTYSAVTAFEVLEHLEDPVGFIENALTISNADSFIFSTELFNDQPPSPDQWWYYTLNTGQHIAFYQNKTLVEISKKLNMNFYSENGIHIFTNKTINNNILRIITGKLSTILSRFAKKKMRSLTFEDHQKMLQNVSGDNEHSI